MWASSLNIDTTSPVLVTGATGYIAGVLIRQLLELGVNVHATVRDPSKTSRLQPLLDLANNLPGSIQFFKGDLLEEGSFADGMKECTVVFHVASPCIMEVPNPQKDLVEPAVNGTKNVLNEATKSGTVKRVVLTSSDSAIYCDATDTYQAPDGRLTEDHWNTGIDIRYDAYALSKTKAEQAAWEIAESQNVWTLVVMNPSVVMGPGIMYHESSESFDLMRMLGGTEWWAIMGSPCISMGVVDVREVAQAHIVGAYSNEAKGRHILCGTNTNMTAMADILRQQVPTYRVLSGVIPKRVAWLVAPFAGVKRRFIWRNTDVPLNLDNSKSKRELGIDYRPLAETLQDMFQQLIDVGVFKENKI
jgi:dihydroflavonol-4-reductase